MAMTGFIRVNGKLINPDHVERIGRDDSQQVLLVKMARGDTIRVDDAAEIHRIESEFDKAMLMPSAATWTERARWSSEAFQLARELMGPVDEGKRIDLTRRAMKLAMEIGLSAEATDPAKTK